MVDQQKNGAIGTDNPLCGEGLLVFRGRGPFVLSDLPEHRKLYQEA
jgi:hypothetical protein